jgi:hypothetical protein
MRSSAVWRTQLVVLLVYLLLAVLLTWPTVTHIATHLPGDGGDDPAIAWNLWWVKHSLLTLQTNPLFSDYMFYPIGVNLAFYTLTVLNALTAMPLTLTLGVVTASNLHMWFTMLVGGYGMFLLVRESGNQGSGNQESGLRESGGRDSGNQESGLGKSGNRELEFSDSPIPDSLVPDSPIPDSLSPDSLSPDSSSPDSLIPDPPSPNPLPLGAAALAGGFYAFASSQLFYLSLGQFNIASSHWVPYALLFVFKSRRDLSSLRWPLLAALFLIMQAWAEMTYASFLLVFIALYVAYETVTSVKIRTSNVKRQTSNVKYPKGTMSPPAYPPARPGRARGQAIPKGHDVSPGLPASLSWPGQGAGNLQSPIPKGHDVSNLQSLLSYREIVFALRNLLVLAFLFALGISPLLAAMLPDMRSEGDFWVQGSGFAESYSADLAGFLVPTMHHPLLGGLVGRTGIANFDKGQHIYLGFTLLILAAVGLVANRRVPLQRRGFWLIAALCFAWLSLGPTVHVNGADTGIPGPFVILQSLPFFKGNRYPSRYSVLLVLSLAMLAAMGIEALGRSIARRRQGILLPAAGCLLSALFLFEHLSIPLPQSDMTLPAPYIPIAAEPGQFTLLDIPLAWRNGFRITGPHHPGFMFGQFYQTVHGRQLLQGNTSRNPEFKFQYFTQAPVINSILALETGHQLPPERWEPDRAIAGDVLRFFDIQYIVVRPCGKDVSGDVPCTSEATLPYVEGVMPVQPTHRDPAMSVYRVNLPPLPSRVEVSASAPLARLYLGEGWGAIVDQPVWAQRQTARLFVPLDGKQQEVTLRLFAPRVEYSAPGEEQRLVVSTNGWRSAPLSLRPGWGEYTLTLPAGAVQAGLNEIHLQFDRLYPVASLLQEEDIPPAPSIVGTSPVALLVQSAGKEVGDFGHIYVNGLDVSPNRRGYNVAALSPQGDLQIANFDTFLDPGASSALAAFIAALPQGHIVAVAAADEASMNLGEEGVSALRSIGAKGDLRGKYRWSHAVIGVKGAGPGSALEALDGLRPVSVAAGPALTEPGVAAALEWIRFAAAE